MKNNHIDEADFDLVNDMPVNHQDYIDNIVESPAKRKSKRKK